MTRVVTGRKDDTAIGLEPCDCKFSGGSCCQTDVRYVKAHSHERSAYDLTNHLARQACVTAHYDTACGRVTFTYPCSIGRYELYNIKRSQAITGGASYFSANTGDGFYHCH